MQTCQCSSIGRVSRRARRSRIFTWRSNAPRLVPRLPSAFTVHTCTSLGVLTDTLSRQMTSLFAPPRAACTTQRAPHPSAVHMAICRLRIMKRSGRLGQPCPPEGLEFQGRKWICGFVDRSSRPRTLCTARRSQFPRSELLNLRGCAEALTKWRRSVIWHGWLHRLCHGRSAGRARESTASVRRPSIHRSTGHDRRTSTRVSTRWLTCTIIYTPTTQKTYARIRMPIRR